MGEDECGSLNWRSKSLRALARGLEVAIAIPDPDSRSTIPTEWNAGKLSSTLHGSTH
jgi:hypothetical protein